jgi:hypothetical protein
MKSNNLTNLFILFFILIVLGFLYKRFEDKRIREENEHNYSAIQNYLLDGVTLAKSKKPILWIHIPYEYNSRNWLSFGSRSSFNLNQPYLYLTVRSIIKHCEDDFTICIIDDNSFKKLIPNWNINMTSISDPVLFNIRNLALSKLLYIYGGFICPISFVCLKDLIHLYNKGIQGDKMFVCETINRSSSSLNTNFSPSFSFCGAPKECEVVLKLCENIQRIISDDYTDESIFLGEIDKWLNEKIHKKEINLIDGIEIGVKTNDENQIILDDLLSNHYLDLYKDTYGILIPADEILNRRNFGWFARLSEKQVLESDTIIGNYILLSVAPNKNEVLEPLQPLINKNITNKFVGFWKTPNYPGLYGLKPNFLGDNLYKMPYTGR